MKNKQSLFYQKKKLLKEAGCDDYKESAKRLFSKAFKISLAQSYKYQTYEGSNENASLFSEMVSRRAVGVPTSHIVCSRSFWQNDFYVDGTVLDPRPESELIVNVTKNILFDGKKKFMGREFMGIIRTTYLIDKKGKILEVWDNVKVKDHAKEVLETLQSIVKK